MRRSFILVTALVFAGGLAACGDDDSLGSAGGSSSEGEGEGSTDDLAGDDDSLEATEDPTGETPGATGSGVATIGAATFEFEVTVCAFGPDEVGRDDGIFAMQGAGEGGLIVHVSSTDSDPDDPGAEPFDNISLERGDERYGAVNIPQGGQPGFLEIDGKSVSAASEFVDESDDSFIDGTFEATCP